MKANLLYLIGEPGIGKSTLMKEMLGAPHFAHKEPIPHTVHIVNDLYIRQPGALHEHFPGTDRLSMSIQANALEWLSELRRTYPESRVAAEGDRLSTFGFLNGARAAGYDVRVIWLKGSAKIAQERRRQRSGHTGREQSPAWLSGRITKINNLAEKLFLADIPVEMYDAAWPTDAICRALWTIEPIFLGD